MEATGEVVQIAIDDLTYGPKVRDEVDLDHVARLVAVLDRCPPIVVRAESMQVLDGNHRTAAAKREGRTHIAAVVVACDDVEAWKIAVVDNGKHGKPFTLAERKAAAVHFIAETAWSDGRIAGICGITDVTVAALRPVQPPQNLGLDTREGADNRKRPTDPSARRTRVSMVIDERPDASDREVARETGASPSTVGDVRRRKNEGEPVVPAGLRVVPNPPANEVRVGDVVTFFPVKGGWAKEPCIRTNEAREFARWMDRNLPNDKTIAARVVAGCPAELAQGAIAAAKCAAGYWTQIAEELAARGLSAVEAK